MGESLALKYRPRTWTDLIGQKAVQVVLQQMTVKDEVPHALLFEGSRGTGKTTTVRVLAAALNCEMPPGPCTQCPSCQAIYDGNSLALYEIDAASNGLVDDIRHLREQVMYSVGAKKRIVALDEAHSMSRPGFNALLKTLEEPPPDTVFVLLTTEPGKILDTVLSRCMSFNFTRITIKEIVDRLQYICNQEEIHVEPALLYTLAARSNGGMRDAVMTLDQVTRVGVSSVEEYAELMGEPDFAPAIVSKMVSADLSGLFDAIGEQMARTGDPRDMVRQIISVFRDMLVIKAGGDLPIRQGESLDVRRSLASQLEQERIFAALQVLWDLSRMRLGDDARTLIELAAIMVTETLTKGNRTAAVQSSQPARRLSLSEMRTLSM